MEGSSRRRTKQQAKPKKRSNNNNLRLIQRFVTTKRNASRYSERVVRIGGGERHHHDHQHGHDDVDAMLQVRDKQF